MTGATPTSGHSAEYRPEEGQSDARLHSGVFDRVCPPFIAALSPWLGRAPGTVLEIGCGTGQQATASQLAFPALDWWPSDPDPIHRASALAWQDAMRAPARAPLNIDAASDWAGMPEVQGLGPLSAVVAMNVTHIAPWAVTEGILRGAEATLRPGGLLILYGPFHVHGSPTSPGNVTFDARLRADNPAWGLRDVADIEALGRDHGLGFAALLAMPANNRILILRKDG